MAEQKNVTNILIVGVGGQGTILASRVLSEVVCSLGYDVKVSEIHGMSQRGGSVVTQIRFGEKVYSPIVEAGEVDIILAFEMLEGLRWLPYLKQGGCIIANCQQIDPMPVITGKESYPADIPARYQARAGKSLVVDALAAATECGNARAVNIVLLGVLSKMMDAELSVWEEALRHCCKPAHLESNLRAFAKGRSL